MWQALQFVLLLAMLLLIPWLRWHLLDFFTVKFHLSIVSSAIILLSKMQMYCVLEMQIDVIDTSGN